MKQLLILRHGDTFGPGKAPLRIGARTDLPLVENGIRQATAAGRYCATLNAVIVSILAAPLRRTMATARLVANELPYDVPITSAPWLNEIDHGPDEGRTEDEVADRIGLGALREWDRHAIVPPDWQVDEAGRIEAWRTLFAVPWQGTTLTVTSNGMARFALLAASTDQHPPSIKLRTGALGLIRFPLDTGPSLMWWDHRPTVGSQHDRINVDLQMK